MSDYKSMHHGSTSVEFAQFVLKHPKLANVTGGGGEVLFIDNGSADGNWAEAAHNIVSENFNFIGIEKDRRLFEESSLRVREMNDDRLTIKWMDFCALTFDFLEMIRGYDRVVMFLNNDRHRMADSPTNDLTNTMESRLVESLLNYSVGTVLICMGVLPVHEDWVLQTYCVSTRKMKPLTYDPGREKVHLYRYEKVGESNRRRRGGSRRNAIDIAE